MLGGVDPGLSVETDRVDDQGIPFILSGGVPHPRWLQVLGMAASVRGNHVKYVVRFPQYSKALRSLDDLHGISCLPGARVTPRQASGRIIESLALPLLHSPRCVREFSRTLLFAADGRSAAAAFV